MATLTAEQITKWIELNPLRDYRKRNDHMSQSAAAMLIGVSLSAARQWENGVNRPMPEHMERLATLLGLPDGDAMAAAWDAWLDRRPTI